MTIEEEIKKVLEGDPTQTVQNAISLPAIQRYIDRLNTGLFLIGKLSGQIIFNQRNTVRLEATNLKLIIF